MTIPFAGVFKPRSKYISNTHLDIWYFLEQFQDLLLKSGFSFYVRLGSALDQSGVCSERALGSNSRPKADSERHRKQTRVCLGAPSVRLGLVGIVVKENNALQVLRQPPIFTSVFNDTLAVKEQLLVPLKLRDETKYNFFPEPQKSSIY